MDNGKVSIRKAPPPSGTAEIKRSTNNITMTYLVVNIVTKIKQLICGKQFL
jgi:hypothetical protein